MDEHQAERGRCDGTRRAGRSVAEQATSGARRDRTVRAVGGEQQGRAETSGAGRAGQNGAWRDEAGGTEWGGRDRAAQAGAGRGRTEHDGTRWAGQGRAVGTGRNGRRKQSGVWKDTRRAGRGRR